MAPPDRPAHARRFVPHRTSPGQLARALAQTGRSWCWLDGAAEHSAAAGVGEPQTSYFGIAAEVRTAKRGREAEFLNGLRPSRRPDAGDLGGAPRNFSGGWITALSYEFGVALMGLDAAPDTEGPALALRLDVVVAWRHDRDTVELRGANEAEIDAWLREFGHTLEAGTADAGAGAVGAGAADRDPDSAPADLQRNAPRPQRWRSDDTDYARQIEACKQAIIDGEAYVLCLTDTAEMTGAFDPVSLYLALRERGPVVRGGVIVGAGRALVSASPERFLTVRGRTVATHPIKGTRPRGSSPAADAAFASELGSDPKERAENLMIVDLMRNDLSRICVPGSVAVTGFLRVETHPSVHQLVSTVSGELESGNTAIDAVLSCFPGGSMTGAPKRRAVQILAEQERLPRGLYSGCFGWLDHDGNAELAMTIRGIELRDPRAGSTIWSRALIGAGGGITVDSVAEREVAEKQLKAVPLFAALRAGSRG